MVTRTSSLIALSAFLVIAAPSVAAAGPSRNLKATLTGRAEVPGPGKKDATGSATVTILPPRRICYVVQLRNLTDANAAHIHRGSSRRSGPPVITLNQDGREFRGCAVVNHGLIYQLANSPGNFYVNVHSKAFPGGAIRGQLHP